MKVSLFALRNVIRYWRRSLVNILAMTLALGVITFYIALIEGMMLQAEKNIIRNNIGDVQIHPFGYRDNPDFYNTLKNPEDIILKINNLGYNATMRQYGFGLAATDSSSAGVLIRSVDLDLEPMVTEINKKVGQGNWLEKGNENEVILGKKLAKVLGVKPGDELLILSQAYDGSTANLLYIVKGILSPIDAAIDSNYILLSKVSFSTLMSFPNEAHEIVIRRHDFSQSLDLFAESIRSTLGDVEGEILNWKELLPVVSDMLDASRNNMVFFILIAYIAVALIVLNAVLMSVFERMKEFGVLKAIGVTPVQLARLIITEAIIQTTAAVVLALSIVIPLIKYYQARGIDVSGISGNTNIAGMSFEAIWRPIITSGSIVTPVLMLYLIAMIAVIYPMLKAALIIPVNVINEH